MSLFIFQRGARWIEREGEPDKKTNDHEIKRNSQFTYFMKCNKF